MDQHKEHKDKIVKAFNNFDGKNFDTLDQFYSQQVKFVDPVGEVEGLDRLKAYYAHAYKNVKSIRFEFKEFVQQDLKTGASWSMHLAVQGLNGGREYVVSGFSYFHFNKKGEVIFHRDYVDLGEMVYERLPVQGPILRGIKSLLQGKSFFGSRH